VQALTVSDDHTAQDRVLCELSYWTNDPDDIRSALTQDDIPTTDRRARFVTLAAYEEVGGDVRRDLFAEGDEGVFHTDRALLDRLALEKLQAEAEVIQTEGWKWVEPALVFDRVRPTSGFGALSPYLCPKKPPPSTSSSPRNTRGLYDILG
jgi:ParB family chromosome partitioning protein